MIFWPAVCMSADQPVCHVFLMATMIQPEMLEPISDRTHLRAKGDTEMGQQKTKRYTVEKLQEVYCLSLPKAVQILDRFGGDAALIDKLMKRLSR